MQVGSTRPDDECFCAIIIRVSGVRVPPPASTFYARGLRTRPPRRALVRDSRPGLAPTVGRLGTPPQDPLAATGAVPELTAHRIRSARPRARDRSGAASAAAGGPEGEDQIRPG